jgi:hypothetical protein
MLASHLTMRLRTILLRPSRVLPLLQRPLEEFLILLLVAGVILVEVLQSSREAHLAQGGVGVHIPGGDYDEQPRLILPFTKSLIIPLSKPPGLLMGTRRTFIGDI